MTKIYTKTGDDGTTSLFDGTRVSKKDPRVDTYGDVDELNAVLGLVLAILQEGEIKKLLSEIQRDLFALGAVLANPNQKKQKSKSDLTPEKISRLEKAIDHCEAEIDPIKNFILHGGSIASAWLDYARTVCRRAERKVVALSVSEKVNPLIVIYLNQLSDLLFMLARLVNKRLGVRDIPWE